MTGQELVLSVMGRLGVERNSELAGRLALGSYYSPNRVKRWVNGDNDPDYKATIELLDLVGAINWDALRPGQPSPSEDVRQLTEKARRRTEDALARLEELRNQPRPETDESPGG